MLRAEMAAPGVRAYAAAVLVSLAAFGVSLALAPLEPDDSVAALLFLGAVGLAAGYGGLGPAMVPTVAGGLALDYFFETPRYSLAISSTRTLLDLASFVFVALLVSLLNHRLRLANQRLREERDRAEASVKARDELIATVSHALRTPLTAIQASLFSLRDRTSRLPAARRESLLANVAAEADRLVRFVSDALALSRLENAPRTRAEWNDLGEVVWAALERCRPLLSERPVTFAIPDDLPLARFDAGLLDQAVSALIENVASHTPPDAHMWIEAEVLGSELSLAISDAGPGIPTADRERIFQKYERLEGRGSGVGLGLAVARAAVRAQGGRVWVEDSPHGGARFIVRLPGVARARPAA
jgi:K+-sensing histidine kinase KdpD